MLSAKCKRKTSFLTIPNQIKKKLSKHIEYMHTLRDRLLILNSLTLSVLLCQSSHPQYERRNGLVVEVLLSTQADGI